MYDLPPALYGALAVLAAVYLFRWRNDPIHKIPTLGGPSVPILSYLSAFRYVLNSRQILKIGYEKFSDSSFKVALLDQWMVVVNGPQLLDEIRKRPDEELSFLESTEDFLQITWILGPEPHDDPYHIDLIKDKLTRSLPAVLPDVVDELRSAMPWYIPTHGNEWTTIDAIPTVQKVVARLSNRVFVGLPICRNEEYLRLAVTVTRDIVRDGFLLKLFPKAFKPLVASWMSHAKRTIRRALPYLRPVITERKAKIKEHGLGEDWPGKPNDLLQWIIEQAIPRGVDDESIAARVLLVNFAAIHTSSMSVTQALYHLAAAPGYIQPLREEVESITAVEGWTKAAMGKMWKLDSFLKESQRYNGIGLTSVGRKALKDVLLSDGTLIPAGTLVVANSYPMHHDDEYYPNAGEFDPFRFARMRELEGEGTKHQFVNTSTSYVPFGVGRHACPGRFFAANELKAMLAYIVVNYDVKIDGDGARPPNVYFANSVIPNQKGKIMFRKRQVTGAA
ncbi:cytochrome P450 [Dichomitus squalens]|uniref:Cytochrome P450 n=1 Tax=Dichomitus squalens TaxID=114155 RepID=A0A4Q9PUJ3_9APHY|nr:cytochrome P450 [Dichomitus squalens]